MADNGIDFENEQIQKTGIQLIKKFRIAINNSKIYPIGSKIMQISLDELYEDIDENLKVYKNLVLSRQEETILFQGKELIETENMLKTVFNDFFKIFKRYEIKSITLKSDITKKELLFLIENLSTITKNSKEEFTSLFNDNDDSHIAIDKTIYVALNSGEAIIQKVSDMIEQTDINNTGNVLKLVYETYDLMNTVTTEKMKDELQNRLSAKLSELPPKTLKELFEKQLPYKIEHSGLKNKVIAAFSNDKIKEIFNDITNWYQELNKNKHSEFKSIDQLNSLKAFISNILTSPATKEIPFKFYEQLLKVGLIDQIPSNIKKIENEKETLITKAISLISGQNISLLENPTYQELPLIVKKLCKFELYEHAHSLTEKLMSNLESNSSLIRLSTVKLTKKMLKNFTINDKNEENISNILQEKLFGYLDKEFNSEVYKNIIQFFRERIRQLFLKDENDILLKIITKIKEEKNNTQEEEKIKAINELMNQIAADSNEIIINDLKSEDKHTREICLQIISNLGIACTELIIKAIEEIESLRIRRRLAKSLVSLGDEASVLLINGLNPTLSCVAIKRILEVIDEFQEDLFLESLEKLINFPDSAIKKHTIRLLLKGTSDKTTQILLKFTDDPDISVRQEAIQVLGELKAKEAVDKLLLLIKTNNIYLKEIICIALGEIGDERALPVLIKLLKKRTPFCLFKATNERLRLRAAWSLRKFNSNSAKEALSQAIKKDKSNLVCQIAAESLEIINKNQI